MSEFVQSTDQGCTADDAERSLLGAMLTSKANIATVAATVEARDFQEAAHVLLFEALCALDGRGESVIVELAAKALEASGKLEEVGGAAYLQKLHSLACSADRLEAQVTRVCGGAVLRRLEQAGDEISADARAAAPAEADEMFSAAVWKSSATVRERREEEYWSLADIMEPALDAIESISNRSGRMTGVSTGLADLDSLTQGLQPGQFVVLAGRPTMGTSTLALDFARCCSIRHGESSVVFSLESMSNEITMRLLAAEAHVALQRMRSGNMSDGDWSRLADRMGEVSAAPLFVDATPNLTFTQVRSRCRALRARHDLRLAVVDSINAMHYGGRLFDSRYLELSEIAEDLKQLAKELEIPIVATAKLNRGPEARTGKKPMMADLRDSGTLEDVADVVVLVHREAAYEPESPRAGEADLIVAKHRQGPTATITISYQGHYSRFVDLQQS